MWERPVRGWNAEGQVGAGTLLALALAGTAATGRVRGVSEVARTHRVRVVHQVPLSPIGGAVGRHYSLVRPGRILDHQHISI